MNQWELRHDRSPNLPRDNDIAYDPGAKRVVLHGGHMGRLYVQSPYTYLYDIAANRFYESQAIVRPQRRCFANLDYVDSCKRIVSANGSSHHGSLPQGEVRGEYTQVSLGDPRGPWFYSSAADIWEDSRTLPPRWQRRPNAPIAYEASSDMLAGLAINDLMLFCPRTNRVHFHPLPDEMKDLHGYGIAADPLHRKIVVFGGSRPGSYLRQEGVSPEQAYEKFVQGDTWVYDVAGDGWSKCRSNFRPPRGMPLHAGMNLQMVYHDPSGMVLLFQNGTDKHEPDPQKWGAMEMWSFDVATEQWSRRPEVVNAPPMVGLVEYAAAEDTIVMFGGGPDGLEDDGKTLSPALSRHVYALKLKLPNREVLPPPQPERAFAATAEESVTLVWKVAPGASYDIYRAAADHRPAHFTKINPRPIPANQFIDPGVTPGKVFAYQVVQTGAKGRRSLPVFTQPCHPVGLVASVEAPNRVALRWDANAEQDIAGYLVVRADGKELDQPTGKRLFRQPQEATHYVDEQLDLSNGVIRSYIVMAVNRLGTQSGPSPIAYTVPDAPRGLTVLEGVAPGNSDGECVAWTLSWSMPRDVKVAGFNIYHATEHIDTVRHPEKYEAFWKLWSKLNDKPVEQAEFDFAIPQDGPPHHYFFVRAVNILGQEGFCTDIISPTDRRFRP